MRILITVFALLLLSAMLMAGPKDEFVPVDKMPEMTGMTQPAYPAQAKENGIEATVYVKAYIDKDGKVTEAEIVECNNPGKGFEKAALDAAYKCLYNPAEKDGKPVGIWVTYKIQFELDDKKP